MVKHSSSSVASDAKPREEYMCHNMQKSPCEEYNAIRVTTTKGLTTISNHLHNYKTWAFGSDSAHNIWDISYMINSNNSFGCVCSCHINSRAIALSPCKHTQTLSPFDCYFLLTWWQRQSCDLEWSHSPKIFLPQQVTSTIYTRGPLT